MTGSGQRGHFVTRVLQVGITSFAIGLLIYLASRSLGGGLAGVLLSGMLAWFAFELALSVVRGIRRVRARVKPQHSILGGCFTAIAACGVGGLLLFFGYQLILGIILGGIAALVTHRTELPTLAQLAGLDPMPDRAGPGASSIPLLLSRRAAAIVALLCFLAGFVFAGLGTIRVLEGYSYLTDFGCTHPCGMVHGLWVQVLPDSQGDFVSRLDPVAVRLRVRFRDDVAGDKVASRNGFTLTSSPVTYLPLTDRPGCDPWPPRILHIDDNTADLTLCFAIPQPENVDFGQLVLEWAQAGATAPILLGKKSRGGVGIEINVSPSPSQP
jgi:hypothetical protein